MIGLVKLYLSKRALSFSMKREVDEGMGLKSMLMPEKLG